MRWFISGLILLALVLPAEAHHARHHRHHLRHVHHRMHRARVHVRGPLESLIHDLGRPFRMLGELLFDGDRYHFASGGALPSIPYGTYPITPDAVGSWGARHQAIGINGGKIWDKSLHRYRVGIELHGGNAPRSEGCVVLSNRDFTKVRRKILAAIKNGKQLYLHVTSRGIEINENA